MVSVVRGVLLLVQFLQQDGAEYPSRWSDEPNCCLLCWSEWQALGIPWDRFLKGPQSREEKLDKKATRSKLESMDPRIEDLAPETVENEEYAGCLIIEKLNVYSDTEFKRFKGIKPADAEEIDKMSADAQTDRDTQIILIKKLEVIGEEVKKYQDILKQLADERLTQQASQVTAAQRSGKPGSRHGGKGEGGDKSQTGGSVRGSNRHTHDDGTSSTMTGPSARD